MDEFQQVSTPFDQSCDYLAKNVSFLSLEMTELFVGRDAGWEERA
jgi:hypothetical protein